MRHPHPMTTSHYPEERKKAVAALAAPETVIQETHVLVHRAATTTEIEIEEKTIAGVIQSR